MRAARELATGRLYVVGLQKVRRREALNEQRIILLSMEKKMKNYQLGAGQSVYEKIASTVNRIDCVIGCHI